MYVKMGNNKVYKENIINIISSLRTVMILPGNQMVVGCSHHALSPRYDSLEECRVSYLFFGGVLDG